VGTYTDTVTRSLSVVAPEKAELTKVIVLGNDRRVVARSVLPDLQVNLPLDQAVTEILVEQQAHAGGEPASRRSRAAANAKVARMSSRVRDGKSARI